MIGVRDTGTGNVFNSIVFILYCFCLLAARPGCCMMPSETREATQENKRWIGATQEKENNKIKLMFENDAR